MSFRDKAHVDRIKDALWSRRPSGTASVMVGSGFSLNARPCSVSSRPMPIWSRMAERICDHLYPADDSSVACRRSDALRQAAATNGFLRLAQEFQAAFGRSALDNFIRDLIPDEDYEPDDLHTLLLKLPWSDVFTTNWDTLMERARREVFGRSYTVVRTMSEIPASIRPRIAKLHGSLPANGPFIFTEEDYRTYPSQFAPFVNLVQQSMMENVFCLIGFSGDDPNFLHWSGWVRDNLGSSAPKIYLVGWLDLSPHRRRMLEDRNVVPVDLARLPQGRNWPEHLNHRYAIEWFLWNLRDGEPYRAFDWPSPRVHRIPSVPAHLGYGPPIRNDYPLEEEDPPGPHSKEQLLEAFR